MRKAEQEHITETLRLQQLEGSIQVMAGVVRRLMNKKLAACMFTWHALVHRCRNDETKLKQMYQVMRRLNQFDLFRGFNHWRLVVMARAPQTQMVDNSAHWIAKNHVTKMSMVILRLQQRAVFRALKKWSEGIAGYRRHEDKMSSSLKVVFLVCTKMLKASLVQAWAKWQFRHSHRYTYQVPHIPTTPKRPAHPRQTGLNPRVVKAEPEMSEAMVTWRQAVIDCPRIGRELPLIPTTNRTLWNIYKVKALKLASSRVGNSSLQEVLVQYVENDNGKGTPRTKQATCDLIKTILIHAGTTEVRALLASPTYPNLH